MNKIEVYHKKIHFGQKKKIIDNILNILIHKEIYLGSVNYYDLNKKYVSGQIDYFINKNLPVQFSLLGLPHKMPNQLLTDEKDAGGTEVAMLLRLNFILKQIKKIYPPGALINFFTEQNIFACLSDISNQESNQYINSVKQLIYKLGLSQSIIFKDLIFYEKQFPEFNKIYLENVNYFKNNHKESVEKTRLNFFYTSNDQSLSLKESTQVFNLKITLNELKPYLRYYRINFWEKTLPLSIQYLAYHKTRKILNFMDKIATNNIKLTVAPKVGSIGINLINSKTLILPYYGYLVFNKDDYTIKYKIDILGKAKNYLGITDLKGKLWYFETILT